MLAHSELWTEVEQQDEFCFALQGMASEYKTLLLETDPRVRLGDILKKFDKRFASSADKPHQLNLINKFLTFFYFLYFLSFNHH